MRNLLILLTLFIFPIMSCTSTGIRISPKHSSISPELVPYLDKYKYLGKKRGIVFSRDYSAQITEIDYMNKPSVIGLCYRGVNFREIEIDKRFFNKSSIIERFFLVSHEATHCICNRKHDFDNGKLYTENNVKSPETQLKDGCPKSIMSLYLPSRSCLEKHYEYYSDEMFNRCTPW